MSEADAAPAAVATCANCGAELRGRFCAMCGQESKPLDPPVRHVIGEFAQELLDVDGRLLQSLRRLLFSPGFLTREHVRGRRAPWVSPLKLYLLASVVMFTMSALAGSWSETTITTSGDAVAVAERLRQGGYASVGELQRAIETARLTWVPRVMFVLVPLFAGLVAFVERRARRHYPSHLVFALHVHAAGFVVRAVAAGCAEAVPPAWGQAILHAANLYIAVYLFMAFRSAYGTSRLRAAVETAVVVAVYVLILVLATMAIVSVAMFGPRWFA
jgi:hypothetical protein